MMGIEKFNEFLDQASSQMKGSFDMPIKAQWITFPEYERTSLGWKMGSGEDYIHAFQ